VRSLPLVVACLLVSPLHAATFTVTATNDRRDAAPGDGVCDTGRGTCTLRAAVEEANALGGDNAIVLPAGRFALTLTGLDADAHAGDLDVLGTLTITGAGAGATVIDASKAKDRAFQVLQGGSLDLSGVTIRGGRVKGRDVGGGGISVEGTLALHDAVITGCRSDDDAGAIDVQEGTVALTDVKLVRNRAGDDGGAMDVDGGRVTMLRVVIARNRAADEGGGFENSGGDVTLHQVKIAGNRATTDAGGISIEDGATTLIDGCTITHNRAKRGGGLFTDDTVRGANTTVVSGTTLHGNKNGDCDGALVDGGGNVGDATCGFQP
jgi:CSLREA domain-containing protein